MSAIIMLAVIIACIGAINWGLQSVFNINLVSIVTVGNQTFEKIVYMIVGVSGLIALIGTLFGL